MKLTQGFNMAEPASSTAGIALGWKAAGLAGLVGTGVIGALFMAWFDPPKDKPTLFMQAAVAAVTSLLFGPAAVRYFDHLAGFIDLTTASGLETLEWAAPIFFIVGALSWGGVGMLVKLREIVRERGAEKIAGKTGL